MSSFKLVSFTLSKGGVELLLASRAAAVGDSEIAVQEKILADVSDTELKENNVARLERMPCLTNNALIQPDNTYVGTSNLTSVTVKERSQELDHEEVKRRVGVVDEVGDQQLEVTAVTGDMKKLLADSVYIPNHYRFWR